jgi:hypothetical protein
MTDSASGARPALKRVLGIVVVLGALGAVGIGLVRQSAPSPAPATAVGEPAELPQIDTVYYIHGKVRCETCLAIEARTTALVHEAFADRLAEGSLRFEVVNMDLPRERDTPRQVRARLRHRHRPGRRRGGGAWADLADVWTYIHEDGRAFEDYLAGEITRVLEPAG